MALWRHHHPGFVLVALLLAVLMHAQQAAGYAFVTLLVTHPQLGPNVTYMAEMAAFGPPVKASGIAAPIFVANPPDACAKLIPPTFNATNATTRAVNPWIALVIRGDCNFEDKVVRAQEAGAAFVIVYNNVATLGNALVTMSPGSSGGAAVRIPSAFISKDAGLDLIAVGRELHLEGIPAMVTSDNSSGPSSLDNHWAIIVFVGILAILISSFFIMIFLIVEIYRQRRRRHRRRPKPVPVQVVITLPTKDIAEPDLREDKNITCAICLDDFEVGSKVRQLPCNHEFHVDCVDPWLMKHNRFCPVCKMDIERGIELRKLEENGELGEVIEMQDMNRPSSSTATFSQRDSTGDIEEGGIRSSVAVLSPFETIHEEPAAPSDHQGEENGQEQESGTTPEVHHQMDFDESPSSMKPASSSTNLVVPDDDEEEEDPETHLTDKRRGLLSFLKGKSPESKPDARLSDDADHVMTV